MFIVVIFHFGNVGAFWLPDPSHMTPWGYLFARSGPWYLKKWAGSELPKTNYDFDDFGFPAGIQF